MIILPPQTPMDPAGQRVGLVAPRMLLLLLYRPTKSAHHSRASPPLRSPQTRRKACSEFDCATTGQQPIANADTTLGNNGATCCEDITGRCSGNTDSTADFDYTTTSQQLISSSALTDGSTTEACCEDITGRCSGNTDSTANFDCSTTSQQLISSSAFTDGTTAEVCCEDITGRCSGNTDSTANFDCSTHSYLMHAACRKLSARL